MEITPDIVIQGLQATTSNDNTIRRQAEAGLNEMSNSPGFFPCLLSILGQNELPNSVRISASIFLKNRLRNRYSDEQNGLCENDKIYLRQNIIPIMCGHCDYNTNKILSQAIEEMVQADFPERWNCVDQIDSYFAVQDPHIIFNAVYIVRSIMRCYQYRSNKEKLHALTSHFYPVLLQCARICTENISDTFSQQLLHLIVKTYYTSLDMTSENVSYFQVNNMSNWVPFLCELLQLPILNPENNLTDVFTQEKAQFPEWHIKKWCMSCLNRICGMFIGMKKCAEYNMWINDYAPHVTQVVFDQLNVYTNSVYYHNKVVIKFFTYLRNIIDVSKLYKIVKGQIIHIINNILPKAMTITPEEQELWVEDPVRFVNQVYDMYYEFTNVRMEAGTFLTHLAKVRANDILRPFLNYLTDSFNQFRTIDPSKQDFLNKEWMLYALEILASNTLSKDELKHSVETVLMEFVFPEFQSPAGFLRARACRVYAAFKKLEMNENHLREVVNRLLGCLNDAEFPVCVTAAISLQAYIDKEEHMSLIRPSLQQVVERFVFLLQKVVVEEIMQTFDLIINRFEADLLPLSSSILSILLSAFNEYRKDEDNDSAIFTAMSTIECITSIVANATAKPEYYDTVINLVLPCLMDIIQNNNADYYESCFTALRFFIHFYENSINTKQLIWECYPQLLMTVQSSAMDYVGNFFAVVDGYLNCSLEQMTNLTFNGKTYLQMLFDFVNEALFDPELEAVEQGYACGILMVIIHYCYPTLDSVLEPCVQIAQKYIVQTEAHMQALMTNEEDESIRDYYLEMDRSCVVRVSERRLTDATLPRSDLRLNMMECKCAARMLMVIESAFIIHPDFTLNYLVSVNYADQFMKYMMDYLDAHDSLLSNRIAVISLASLFTLPYQSLPASFQNGYSSIFQACLTAMNEVVQLRKEGAGEELDDIDYDAIMEKIQGQSFTQNDWGFGEDCDVEENEDDGLDMKQLEMMTEDTFREIDVDLITDITSIKEIAYVQQALTKGSQMQGNQLNACVAALNEEARMFFNDLMQQQTEDVTYF